MYVQMICLRGDFLTKDWHFFLTMLPLGTKHIAASLPEVFRLKEVVNLGITPLGGWRPAA